MLREFTESELEKIEKNFERLLKQTENVELIDAYCDVKEAYVYLVNKALKQ